MAGATGIGGRFDGGNTVAICAPLAVQSNDVTSVASTGVRVTCVVLPARSET
jgi:hypothetical protein